MVHARRRPARDHTAGAETYVPPGAAFNARARRQTGLRRGRNRRRARRGGGPGPGSIGRWGLGPYSIGERAGEPHVRSRAWRADGDPAAGRRALTRVALAPARDPVT